MLKNSNFFHPVIFWIFINNLISCYEFINELVHHQCSNHKMCLSLSSMTSYAINDFICHQCIHLSSMTPPVINDFTCHQRLHMSLMISSLTYHSIRHSFYCDFTFHLCFHFFLNLYPNHVFWKISPNNQFKKTVLA